MSDIEYHKPYRGERVLTADGVEIIEGLRVWTNDLTTGVIDLTEAEYELNHNTGEYTLWFRVKLDAASNDRGVLQSEDRVATKNPFTGEIA
jgi:hypothetical protein